MSFFGDAWDTITSPFKENTKAPTVSGYGATFNPYASTTQRVTGGQTAASIYTNLGADAQQAQRRTTPELDYSQADATRGMAGGQMAGANAMGAEQAGLLGRLREVEAGRGGPSVAELAMRSQADQAARSNLAIAAGGGGTSGAGMGLAAMNANAAQQGALVRDVGVQRAAEIAQARGQIADVAGTARTQAMQGAGVYGSLADAYGAQAQNRAQLELDSRGQAAQEALAYRGLQQQFLQAEQGREERVEEARVRAGQQDDALRTGQYTAQAGIEAQRDGSIASLGGSLLAAGIGALSDIRAKKNVRGTDAVAAFEPLGSYAYDYRDPYAPGARPGPNVGPMAQELARTPEGRTVVERGPDGRLSVDSGRLAMMNASATGDLARRLDALEAEQPAATRRGPRGSGGG